VKTWFNNINDSTKMTAYQPERQLPISSVHIVFYIYYVFEKDFTDYNTTGFH